MLPFLSTRPLHIRTGKGVVHTIYCGADFYIEDVKEELSCLPSELPPERQRIVFAGRCESIASDQLSECFHTLLSKKKMRESSAQRLCTLFRVVLVVFMGCIDEHERFPVFHTQTSHQDISKILTSYARITQSRT